jgi:hypothetical protein
LGRCQVIWISRGGRSPADLVIQLGRLLPNGSVERNTTEYRHVLNTAAARGVEAEASAHIRYTEQTPTLADRHLVNLRVLEYVLRPSGANLPVTGKREGALIGVGVGLLAAALLDSSAA